MRCRVEHEKRNFLYTSDHILFCFRLFVCIYDGYDNYDANKTILIYNDNGNCDAYKVMIIMMNVKNNKLIS